MFPDMKVATLLLIWWLPVLQAGGPGHSRCLECVARGHHVGSHILTLSMERAQDAFPDNSAPRSPGLYVEDEEDPVEDNFVADGLWLSRLWWDPGQGGYSPFVRGLQDLLRIPASPHPLRC